MEVRRIARIIHAYMLQCAGEEVPHMYMRECIRLAIAIVEGTKRKPDYDYSYWGDR